jgi:hypothetical protein
MVMLITGAYHKLQLEVYVVLFQMLIHNKKYGAVQGIYYGQEVGTILLGNLEFQV